MSELEFNINKQRRIKEIKDDIELVENGQMLKQLRAMLRMAERQTYAESPQRRFIVN